MGGNRAASTPPPAQTQTRTQMLRPPQKGLLYQQNQWLKPRQQNPHLHRQRKPRRRPRARPRSSFPRSLSATSAAGRPTPISRMRRRRAGNGRTGAGNAHEERSGRKSTAAARTTRRRRRRRPRKGGRSRRPSGRCGKRNGKLLRRTGGGRGSGTRARRSQTGDGAPGDWANRGRGRAIDRAARKPRRTCTRKTRQRRGPAPVLGCEEGTQGEDGQWDRAEPGEEDRIFITISVLELFRLNILIMSPAFDLNSAARASRATPC